MQMFFCKQTSEECWLEGREPCSFLHCGIAFMMDLNSINSVPKTVFIITKSQEELFHKARGKYIHVKNANKAKEIMSLQVCFLFLAQILAFFAS